MNIFYTDDCPIVVAEQHCYRHQTKMIVEHCQMLSTAHHVIDNSGRTDIYKKTHHNHPSSVWVRARVDHYEWLWLCTKRLCELYTERTGKAHKTETVLDLLIDPPAGISSTGFTQPPLAASEEFHPVAQAFGVIEAYQQYLNSKFAEWLSRAKPLKVEFDSSPWWVDLRV